MSFRMISLLSGLLLLLVLLTAQPVHVVVDNAAPVDTSNFLEDNDLKFNNKMDDDNSYQSASSKTCDQEQTEINERLARLERIYNTTHHHLNADLDDVSLLEEMFHGLTTQIIDSIPETDEECWFNMTSAVCMPRCSCAFHPKLGDYSLGRMCRLRSSTDQYAASCDETIPEPTVVHKVRQVIQRVAHKVKRETSTYIRNVLEKAPSTDALCSWSFKEMACQPTDLCDIQFRFGDYSLSRACRLQRTVKKPLHISTVGEEEQL